MRVCEQCLQQLPSSGGTLEMVAGGDDTFINLAHEPDFCLAAMVVRPSLREIEADGHVETIEPRVMQALVARVRAKGNVVSRDTLIALCWRGRVVGDDAINRCIAKLRHVAEHPDSAPFTVETVPRVGYRLRLAEPAAPPAAGTDAAEPILSVAATMPLGFERPRRRFAMAMSALCAVVMAAAVWHAHPGHRGEWAAGNSGIVFGSTSAEAHPAIAHRDTKTTSQAKLKGAGNDLHVFELLRYMQ